MDFSQPAPWHFFFYRFVMVVRKNVLEYIIALVVVKNKVRLKKCSTINVNKFLNWCPRGGSRGRAHPARAPTLKLEKIWFFGVKSWFFTRNTPTICAPASARRNCFKCGPLPPNLKSWIRPYWSQYVHYQCNSRRWIQNWSVWDIFFKWLKLC